MRDVTAYNDTYMGTTKGHKSYIFIVVIRIAHFE